jgi:hypothetical protein
MSAQFASLVIKRATPLVAGRSRPVIRRPVWTCPGTSRAVATVAGGALRPAASRGRIAQALRGMYL